MFQPTKEQAAAIHAQGSSLLVSAAAGSGKTKVLVERLMDRLTDREQPCNIGEFLVITYTKAAAAELRGKIIEELGKRLAEEPKNRHLQRQSTLVYHGEIKTIHSFCQSLIRKHAHRMGVDPSFRVGDEMECRLLRRKVLDRVLEQWYETQPEESPFYALVDLYSAGRDDNRLIEIVLNTEEKLQSHPYPKRWFQQQREALLLLPNAEDAGETPWGRLLLEDGIQQCSYWKKEMSRALCWIEEEPSLAKGYAASFQTTVGQLEQLQQAMEKGWDGISGFSMEEMFPRLKGVRGLDHPERQERVKTIRTRCKQRITKLLERFSTQSKDLLSDMMAVAPVIGALFDLVLAFEEAYHAEKRRRKLLDFSDLEHIALHHLVQPETGLPTELALETQARYKEILVDEYQDVNRVQDAIFHALSREGKNLFFVGDVKQSIYRFRMADPTLFLEKYKTFTPYDETASEAENRRIVLSRNFRSRKEVLEATNFLFSNLMSEAFGEMNYTEAEALYPGASYPEGTDYGVELRVLEWDDPDEEPDEEKPGKTAWEADAVAERVKTLLEEAFPIWDQEIGQMRPVTSNDIVILLRSPNTVLHHYTRALAQREIPFVTEGGEAFLSTVEIAVMISLLKILDNPRQDIPLISVLRSPLFGFTEDQLAEIRMKDPKQDFYGAMKTAAGTMEDCRKFLQDLDKMRIQATHLPLHQLLWQLYTRWNVLGAFGALPGGEKRQKNLILLSRYAEEFERTEHKGLFAFLTRIRRMEENGEDFASPGGSGENGVRIMSIHKSKGLEFPVVLLAGLSKRFNLVDLQRPILVHETWGVGPKWLDRERMVTYPTLARMAVAHQLDRELRAEELRLLYVAMTRAKEKLILFCSIKGKEELQQYSMDAGRPMDPQVLASSPSMTGWILPLVMTKPEAGVLREEAGLGEEGPEEEEGTPWNLFLEKGKGTGDQKQKEVSFTVCETEEKEEPPFAWTPFFHYPHQGADQPSKVTATSFKGQTKEGDTFQERKKVYRPRFAVDAKGLTPSEKGTALHLAMQFLDYNQTEDGPSVQAELHRMVQMALLTEEQAKAVPPQKIVTLFASPLGKRLRSGTCKREFTFSVLMPAERYYQGGEGEQVLLQGVIDCYLEEADGITIVDFKTDYVRPGEERDAAAQYEGQLHAYRDALERITGKKVCHQVIYFFATDTELELPS